MWTAGATFKTVSSYKIDGQIQCGQPQLLKHYIPTVCSINTFVDSRSQLEKTK